MFVKICAVTSPADAVLAADAGADAIGMIFAPSRRRVDLDRAREIAGAVAGRVITVGVFRDHTAREVLDTVEAVGLDAAQLHGVETPAASRLVRASVPVVFRAMAVDDPQLPAIDEHGADVVVVDAPVPGGGEVFDWSLLGDLTSRHRTLLAGGLHPGNVAAAIAAVGPWGVDVASGTEASFGTKDPEAVRRFVAEARAAATDLHDPHPPLTVPDREAGPGAGRGAGGARR